MTHLSTGGGSILSNPPSGIILCLPDPRSSSTTVQNKTVKKKAAQKSDTSAGKSKELPIRDKSDVVKKVYKIDDVTHEALYNTCILPCTYEIWRFGPKCTFQKKYW